MSSKNKDLINNFYQQIEQITNQESMLVFNDFIFATIKIINFLSNNKSTTLKIALDLGFIIDNPKNKNPSVELTENLNNIPGFSRLLINILEDYEIKNNIDQFFSKSNIKYHAINIHIKNMHKFLDRYEDICAIFDTDYHNVAVSIFLHGCQNILKNIYSHNKSKKKILQWLIWRKQKCHIISLFEIFSDVKLGNINNLDILLSYICIYADKELIFGNNLENILKRFDLLALNQLREADWFYS